MPDLDASVDCDEDSCSCLDLVGCELVSREECNRRLDEAIKSLPSPRYVKFMNYLQQHFPRTYRAVRTWI